MIETRVTGILVDVEDTSWQGRNGLVSEQTAVVHDGELRIYHRVKVEPKGLAEIAKHVGQAVELRCRASAKAGGRQGAWLDLWGATLLRAGERVEGLRKAA